MPFTYDYPRPSVTTDCLIFSGTGKNTSILLIKRGKEPFKGIWALPGGFLDLDEEIEDCAKRELEEETGITGIELRQLFTIGTIGRDPRGRTITIMYYGIADKNVVNPKAGDDAAEVRWFELNNLPELAFDHLSVINLAFKQIFQTLF